MRLLLPIAVLCLLSSVLHAQDTIPYSSSSLANVFTPNGDGSNDVFTVNGLQAGDQVQIYNRWGTLVYKFRGVNDRWDGRNTSGGKEKPGVYFYVVTRSSGSDKGFLHILD